MPPPASRVLSTFQSQCQLCPFATGTRRAFSASSSRHKIGPESPKFIEVPQAVQPRAPPRPIVKGILPIPRRIFPDGDDTKVSHDYLAKVTPEPSSTHVPRGPDSARLEWKQRMAALRRKNLREGIEELHSRKQQTDRYLAQRSARRQRERQSLIDAPEREDERLTSVSITQAVRDALGPTIYAGRRSSEKTRREMRKRVEREEKARQADRQDALHTLYMHARDFITTEAQLNAAVDEAFGTPEEPVVFESRQGGMAGPSIWAMGEPDTVQKMLDKSGRTGVSGYAGDEQKNLTYKRVKRIAEELTGGKI